MRFALPLVVAWVCVLGCGSSPATPAASPAGPTAASPASASLAAFFATEWDERMKEWPTWASDLGDHRFDDRWPDMSPAAFERRAAHARDVAARAHAFDEAGLCPQDRLSLEIFTREADVEVEGEPYRLWHLVLDQRGGIQSADDLADSLPFQDVAGYQAWIARLLALPAYVDQTVATMREGIAEHIVQPRVVMERLPAQIARQIVDDPTQSPFWAPFRHEPASLSPADRTRLEEAARAAITGAVVPAYRRFADFFAKEYLPACFADVGAWQLPKGDQAYAYLARLHTTTAMTPQQIHDVGLREVARIRSEMLALLTKTGFKGGLPQFFAWLRSDPQFFYPDARSLFEGYESTAKRIDPRLSTQFHKLPRTPYGVEAIPDATAPDTTAAYYREPSADGARAGTFFVNLYKPETRPRWEMMALALHESVPGHHLQIAIASEQTNLPAFRRFDGFDAYTEGWGLYAESLGEDMGLYDDPYSKFGPLTYEMWRSVRLVVDTGMHGMHWSRKQAIDYFLENAPKTELDVVNEIDRYIAWPGQALAYKIGQLEILRLREHARAELGPRFDVKAFHDVVLRDGALPLDVLSRRVDAWIAETKG
jgi:prolyl oligopeptidase